MNSLIGQLVYLLCAGTSIACAILLLRGYGRSRTRLLLWSSLCFVLLAANNVVLVVDLMVLPEIDLSLVRSGLGLAAMAVLLFGLVWDAR